MAKSVTKNEAVTTPSSVKAKIIEQFKQSESDTGSAQVQVALLTNRITKLTGHLNTHKGDKHSRRGLLQMVGQRRKLLTFIEKTEGTEVAKKLKRDIGME